MPKYNRKYKRLKGGAGFTLVELLIALFVFSLLSGFAFMAVKQLSYSSEVLGKELIDLGELNRFWQLLERDVRGVGGVYSPVEPGAEDGGYFILGKAVYRLTEGVLYRKAALVGADGFSESIMLNNVELFEVACQREDNASCDVNVDRKESTMISVELKGPADIKTKRVFYVAGANAVDKALARIGGLSMLVLAGALDENKLKPPTKEEQEIIDVVIGL